METPPIAGARDLSGLREPRGLGLLNMTVYTRFALNYYSDVADVLPAFGIRQAAGEPLAVLCLTGEDGQMRAYVLEPSLIDTIRAATGANQSLVDLVRRLVAGDEDAVAAAEALLRTVDAEIEAAG